MNRLWYIQNIPRDNREIVILKVDLDRSLSLDKAERKYSKEFRNVLIEQGWCNKNGLAARKLSIMCNTYHGTDKSSLVWVAIPK